MHSMVLAVSNINDNGKVDILFLQGSVHTSTLSLTRFKMILSLPAGLCRKP